MTRVLITGGAGFIGHHLVNHFLLNTDWDIVVLDKLNYASSGLDRLRDINVFEENRVLVLATDFTNPIEEGLEKEIGNVEYVFHLGAESITEDTYVPIQSTPRVGTKLLTFGELWDRLSRFYASNKTEKGEAIFLKGRQVKALSFYNGGQWMPIVAITRHKYNGKIIRLRQKWGEIKATPNHSIYSANLELSNPQKNPDLLAIRKINGYKKREISVTKDFLEILAAYITEGNATFNKANGSYIVEIGQADMPWLENIGEKIKFNVGCNFNIVQGNGALHLQVSNKKFFNYLIKTCGKYCDGKFFPDWIFDLDYESQLFFWEKLLEGDGTEDGRYSTTSYKLANQIGLLLSLLGIEYKVWEYNREGYKRSWEFKTQLSGNHHGQNIKIKEEIEYDGWVYDLEIEKSHNFACGLGNIVCHNTHVDNSIVNPEPFVMSNVVGTMRLLDFARKNDNLKKFLYFSTDEVFGPAPQGINYKEWDRYNSTNPYSASKAGGEELSLAYANTYGLPIIITHTMNVFGERQHPEKFIPKIINKVLNNETATIHSDPSKTIPGSRFWVHARNVAAAVMFLLDKSKNRDKYNIVGEKEVNNLEMAKFVANVLGKELKYDMVDFHSSRPGHDLRYALDGTKLKEMGWKFPLTFEQSLQKTILWSIKNSKWLETKTYTKSK